MPAEVGSSPGPRKSAVAKKTLAAAFICLWNAPACYLIYWMAHDMARRRPIGDFGRWLESSEATERFVMDWVAVNCVATMVFAIVACFSPRLQRLVWGKEGPEARERMTGFVGVLTAILLGLLLNRYLS